MEQKKGQGWISTLRGFAILLVFCSHLSSSGGATFKFIIGRIGVVIFFLFSGYLAMESRSKRTSKQYIFNRLLRMYPIYWLLLLLTFTIRNFLQPEKRIALKTFLANLTLFHQFIGIDEIIGSSWMMPIQVCFFLSIGILGISIFTKSYWIGKLRIDMKTATIIGLMGCAIIVGWVRHMTGIPFPTAFFLLMAVAFMGMNFSIENGTGGDSTISILRFAIFEFGLLIAVYFSYGVETISYEIAYNIGLALFFIANRWKLEIECLSKLSQLGFAFFLGAGIPMYVVEYYVDFSVSFPIQVLGWCIKFVIALVFAEMITRYIEKPLLAWGKEVEVKLGNSQRVTQ